jgi:ATP-dependent DNA helicase RecQ
MARYLPQTLEELEKISGFGEVKIKQYGDAFLNVIKTYSSQHHLTSLIHEKTAKKERRKSNAGKPLKVSTKAESFRLFKEGKTIDDIARERHLAIQTIQGHLAEFVQRGDINIEELVSREKILLIEPAVANSESINAVKQKAGDEISFGDIRLVMAWQAFKKEKD